MLIGWREVEAIGYREKLFYILSTHWYIIANKNWLCMMFGQWGFVKLKIKIVRISD